jgi:hypothetical protein
MLPKWVVDVIMQWKAARKSGSIRLNFNQGSIRNIEVISVCFPKDNEDDIKEG